MIFRSKYPSYLKRYNYCIWLSSLIAWYQLLADYLRKIKTSKLAVVPAGLQSSFSLRKKLKYRWSVPKACAVYCTVLIFFSDCLNHTTCNIPLAAWFRIIYEIFNLISWKKIKFIIKVPFSKPKVWGDCFIQRLDWQPNRSLRYVSNIRI